MVEDAEAQYEVFLRYRPDSAEVLNNLGCLHREQGQLRQAINRFQRAIEINAACLPASCRGTVEASARWHAASALRTAERLLAHGAIDQAADVVMHVPALLRLITADAPTSSVQRRLAALQARLSRSGRRAA